MNFILNPYILSSGGYDPNYADYLARAYSEGFTMPTTAHKTVQNQFFLDLKTGTVNGTNNFSTFDMARLFANDNSDLTLIDLVNPSFDLGSLVGPPTFTANQGFTGDGTVAVYYQTNWNPTDDGTNYVQTSASAGYFKRLDNGGGDSKDMNEGNSTTTERLTIGQSWSSGSPRRFYYRMNSQPGLYFQTSPSTGNNILASVTRTGTTLTSYQNSTIHQTRTDSLTPIGIPTNDICVVLQTNAQISFCYAGAHRTANQLADIKAAIDTLLAGL